MGRNSSTVTRLYYRLPRFIRAGLDSALKRSEILLALRFYFGRNNALKENGWFESERRGLPVDGDGAPIPWYTYPMIDFLDLRITEDHRVFEYGSGHSTHWYANRAGTVRAVEHDTEWFETVAEFLPENGEVVLREDPEDYPREIINQSPPFDIVAVDGEWRAACVEPTLEALSGRGVVVWDDLDWLAEVEDYQPLLDAGFRLLRFYGMKALGASYQCTGVFYRDENCLGI